MTLSYEDRLALAKEALDEGRIIQGAWSRKTPGGGKDLVCALAAFGAPGEIKSPEDCPAELMPTWLAELVPVLDDGIAKADVPWFMGELHRCATHWRVLDAAAWERVRAGFHIACIKQAVASAEQVQPKPAPAYWSSVKDACAQMIEALNSGDQDKIKRARAAAEAAAWAAEAAAASAAARAAARVAASAAARAAARVAAWAAAAAAAAEAARAAAREASYRRLAESLFALIDAEIATAGRKPQ